MTPRRRSTKNPVCRDQGASRQTGLYLALSLGWASGGGHAEASARRLQLRVTTPLASTAIFHLLTSFQNFGVTIPDPGANQKGPVLVRKGSFATRHREPTGLLSFRIEDSAREISVVLVRRPPTRGFAARQKNGQLQRFGRLSQRIAVRHPVGAEHLFRFFWALPGVSNTWRTCPGKLSRILFSVTAFMRLSRATR